MTVVAESMTPNPEPTTSGRLNEVAQRIELLHFLTFAAPPKEGNGRITEVTLSGREDLEALAALIGTDVPALLAEVDQLREENRRHQESIEAASRGWRIEVAEVERLRAELEDARVDRKTAEMQRDDYRTAHKAAVEQVEQLRDQLKSDREHAAWVEERRRKAEAERDAARRVRDDGARVVDELRAELATALNRKALGRAFSELQGFAQRETAHARVLTEQVKRVREVAAYFRDRETDLMRRHDEATNDAKATALLSSAALTGDAAHRIERALGGTEAAS